MNKIRVLSAAHRDFLDAVEYYAEVSADLATDFIDSVESAYQLISTSPGRYTKLETNRTDREIRRLVIERFSYIVVYEVLEDGPVVLGIQHTSRHPDSWMRQTPHQ